MSPRAACRLETLGFEQVADYAAGLADWAAAGLRLEGEAQDEVRAPDILRADVPRATLREMVSDVAKRLDGSGWKTAMVVNPEDIVLGRLYRSQMPDDADRTVEEVMQEGPSTIRGSTTAAEVAHLLEANDLSTVPVTTAEGRLLGMILREDLPS